MNDFSEIEHGLKCLIEAWSGPTGDHLREIIDSIHADISKEFLEYFNSWVEDFRSNTYLTCLSEHLDEEDENGRLSMWRAYGGKSGIALVLNLTPFTSTSDELAAFSSPVAYLSVDGFLNEFQKFVDNIEDNRNYLLGLERLFLKRALFDAFRYSVLCTKHPGFSEEREWRIIYSPNIQASAAITSSVRIVRGIPQIIQEIPLKNAPALGLNGAAIPDILNRVIIGPTDDVAAVRQAFIELLASSGVSNPRDIIFASEIPLRQ